MREMEARQEAGRMGKGRRRETKYKRMKEGTVGRKNGSTKRKRKK